MTREEIAKALRACSSDMPCSKCPAYYQKTDLRCVDYMMMCAADMLGQADHFADTGKMVPLTLDELDCLSVGVLGGAPIWIEHRSDKPNLLRWEFSGWQVLRGMEQDYMYLNNDVTLSLKNLNKAWRCWKRQPTQEETANAPWEGAK